MASFPILIALTIVVLATQVWLSNSNDCQTLLDIKSILGITSTMQLVLFASWNSSVSCCMWPGISCGRGQQLDRVQSLNLSSFGLTGTVPLSLANLTVLEVLDLSVNNLHGVIPRDLIVLVGLRLLYLHHNSLSGYIPEIFGGLSEVQEVDLTGNELEGNIPTSLSTCSKLSFLSLGDNKLTGRIPPSICNLTSLIYLHLGFNNLGGVIPREISRLTNLRVLDLMFNHFSGEVPRELYNSSSLAALMLGSNQLSGTLPMDFGNNLPRLEALFLYGNRFEGRIPPSIGNLSSLVRMLLSNNSFVGVVPPSLGNLVNLTRLELDNNLLEASNPKDWNFITFLSTCTRLEIIDLSGNKFGGSLPDSIGNLSPSLQWLRLRNNMITGHIPSSVGKLHSLTVFDIEHNQISGHIPSTLGDLLNLNSLILRYNILYGEIPASLGNLVNTRELFLNNNNLSGTIPESFVSLQKLEVLDISCNKFANSIPKELFGISSLLHYLNFSHNDFSGPLPQEVGKLRDVKSLDFSYNRLSGGIPESLGDCQLFGYLNLQANNFNGTVPEHLRNLRGVQFIDFSRNQLHGSVPEFFGTLPFLEFLNLSFNNFEGEVPTVGIFGNLSSFSITGNVDLCGGDPRLNLKSCSAERHGLSKAILAIIIVASVVILLIGFALIFLIRLYLLTKIPRNMFQRIYFLNDKLSKLSYNDLKCATDEFSASNLVGVGGYGSVYRGFLEVVGAVAVKVFNREIVEASKSFLDECRVLRSISHRNLVRMLFACSTVDDNGNDVKAVVYEFMANGNLNSWLHHEELHPASLNLLQRLDIAIDVAYGLDYLHNDIKTPIVHCDLKPSNVLLDDDMTAKISDFGISRILPPDSELVTIHIRGTFGYIPPECALGDTITPCWDVYSFGILLLEMFTGKRPTAMEEYVTLRQYVEKSFPERVLEILDKKLITEEDTVMAEMVRACIRPVLWVGLVCSDEEPERRVGIRDAVKGLEDAKRRLLAVSTGRENSEWRQSDPQGASSSISYATAAEITEIMEEG